MAIQIPSAAGFIPHQSVLDGIAQIYNLFSPEAKQARQAQTDLLKAQALNTGATAANTQVRTSYIPSEEDRAWRGTESSAQHTDMETGLMPTKVDQEQERINQDASRIAGDLDIRQQALNQSGNEWKDKMGLQQWGLQLEGDRNNQGWAQQQTQDKYRENQFMIQKLDALGKMRDSTIDPVMKDQLSYQMLKDLSPDAAQAMLEHVKRVEALRSQYTKGQPAKTPAPNQPAVPVPQTTSDVLNTLPSLFPTDKDYIPAPKRKK